MLNTISKIGVFVAAGAMFTAVNAATVTDTFSWFGTGGYSATGLITYDIGPGIVEAVGPVYASPNPAFVSGIKYFEVSFYDDSSLLLDTVVEIDNYALQGNQYLEIHYDRSANQFVDYFEVGIDPYLLNADANFNPIMTLVSIVDNTYTELDQGGELGDIVVVAGAPAVPLPAAGWLFASALIGFGTLLRKKSPDTRMRPSSTGEH